MNSTALARKHLERRFMPIRAVADFERPPKGWVRAIRDALGLTTRQLGARLGRAHSNVTVLERNEASDAVTLKLLREAAEAMDCTFVYALVPNRPLDAILRERAARVADRLLAPVSHSMALENQGLDRAALAAERERLIEELLSGDPRRLWDEP
ncbi:MAG TPA: mobile mystery protein A [Allosphingosinicella sp.]|nr:mobile mystery protein A [Allosphingosinicella sp.]